MQYIHTMGYYLTRKMNGVLVHAAARMTLENTVLRTEASRPRMVQPWSPAISPRCKPTETAGGSFPDLEEGKNREQLLMCREFL